MNFTRFDVLILTTMSLSIVLMSFTFPALGLAGSSNETATSDIPEFNVSSNNWDIAGDFPDSPATSNTGTLVWGDQNGLDIGNTEIGYSFIYIDEPRDEGATVEISNKSDGVELIFTNRSGGSIVASDFYQMTGNEDETILHRNESWTIEFETQSVENFNTSDMNLSVEYTIKSKPDNKDSGGLLSGIPIIGGLIDAGSELAATVMWIGEIFFWGFAFITETVLALVGILLTLMIWGTDMMVWMSNTYLDIVTEADEYAAVVLYIPAVLLSAEFAKIAMIGIKLLPTT